MQYRSVIIESALSRLHFSPSQSATAFARFQAQMEVPPRSYHTEKHVEAVLERIFAWSDNQPSISLIAAAIYHDVIYDSKRYDNELQSAVFCHQELIALGITVADVIQATSLILATRFHMVSPKDHDAVLLFDADLYVLGSTPEVYAAYVAAIREEYGHVTDSGWRSGRKAVMASFLGRERIYSGDWSGREAWETQARENIAREIAELPHDIHATQRV